MCILIKDKLRFIANFKSLSKNHLIPEVIRGTPPIGAWGETFMEKGQK